MVEYSSQNLETFSQNLDFKFWWEGDSNTADNWKKKPWNRLLSQNCFTHFHSLNCECCGNKNLNPGVRRVCLESLIHSIPASHSLQSRISSWFGQQIAAVTRASAGDAVVLPSVALQVWNHQGGFTCSVCSRDAHCARVCSPWSQRVWPFSHRSSCRQGDTDPN